MLQEREEEFLGWLELGWQFPHWLMALSLLLLLILSLILSLMLLLIPLFIPLFIPLLRL